MEDMLENHDGRLWDDGEGEVPLLSTELLRLRPPDFGMGMGLASEAPLTSSTSIGPWVFVEFERCRV